jgi:Uma2 family endonuclease
MLVELEPPYLIVKPGATEEEFYALEGEDSRWEFLDGRLVMSPASDRHEDLFRFLLALLSCYLDERGGGIVRGSRYPMRLDERWSPEPDLLVVRDENLHRLTPQYLDGPADLVIEIASDADPQFEQREKLPRYREAGVPEIWIVDRFARVVRVARQGAQGYDLATVAEGRLSSQVLPGFWIDVGWLWQPKLPSSLACLREILG